MVSIVFEGLSFGGKGNWSYTGGGFAMGGTHGTHGWWFRGYPLPDWGRDWLEYLSGGGLLWDDLDVVSIRVLSADEAI